MNIIRSFLLIVEVLCSLMLIGLILLQKSKGGGLGTAFGAGGEGSMFGSRTGNILTKATIVLGLVFLLNTLVLGIMFSRSAVRESALDRELLQETTEQPAAEPGAGGATPGGAVDEGMAPVTGLDEVAPAEDEGAEAQTDTPPADEKENP